MNPFQLLCLFGICPGGTVTPPGGAGVPQGQITNPVLGPTLQNKTGIGFFQSFLPALILWGFVIGSVVFLFIMIIGAIGWITSGGDKTAVEAARGKITGALVGIVLLFSLFAVVKLVGGFFGIDILTLDIGPLKVQ